MNPRTTFVLISLLLLLAGSFWLYEVNKSPSSGTPPPPWFYSFSVDDIVGIDISTQGKTQSFIRGEEGWVFNDEKMTPVDSIRWGGIPLLVSGPKSKRYIPKEELVGDLSSYGLDNPSISIGVTLRGDRRFEAFLGEKDPAAENYYAHFPGDEGVFLITSLWGDVFAELVTKPPYPFQPTLIPAPEETLGTPEPEATP